MHAEGVVSKRINAPYAPGDRGLWRKTKCLNREEFIIVGYTDPEGSRPYLGALLLAYYADDGRLLYAGRAGGGMSRAVLKRLHDTLKPLAIETMPLAAPPPKTNPFGTPLNLSRVHWVRPELVCEVRFLTWTADGLLRQVSYEGLRNDKSSADVGGRLRPENSTTRRTSQDRICVPEPGGHNQMTDDRTNRGAQDRSRISFEEDYEVMHWTKKFGVSRER